MIEIAGKQVFTELSEIVKPLHTAMVVVDMQRDFCLAGGCALVVGDHSLSINAFIIRKPDENQEQVFEWCLRKNASMYAVAFAINELGDLYLIGRLPLGVVSDQELDRLIGSVLQYSDTSFNPLLEMGFASAIRREWAWRLSRGESLANLKAFEHLL